MTDDRGAAHKKLLTAYRALGDEYAGQGYDCDLGDGYASAAHFGISIMSDGQQLAATCRRMKMTGR